MGMEEKNIDDNLWKEFSETGQMPPLPEEAVAAKGSEYVTQLLAGSYNMLMKLLYAEVLARKGELGEKELDAQADAAVWVRRMIFSKNKNYEKSKEMGEALSQFEAKSANPRIKLTAQANDDYQSAWGWCKKVREACQAKNLSAFPVLAKEIFHLSSSSAWERIIGEEKLLANLLFWTGRILHISEGNIGGNEGVFLSTLKKIDTDKYPESLFDQKKIDPKPEKGPGHFPSTAEDIAKGAYRIFKAKLDGRTNISSTQKEFLEWGIKLLELVQSKCPDEWSDYRIGKMLIWTGDTENAKVKILPIARKKQTEFWIWDLLGDLYPDKKKECVAKAILCKGEEVYKKGVLRKAQQLGLPINDENSLKNIAQNVSDILFSDIEPIPGNYVSSFTTNDGNKKIKVVFAVEGGRELIPISPRQVGFPKGQDYGAPVWITLAPEDNSKILRVTLRPEGKSCDKLEQKEATYLTSFNDKNGRPRHVFANEEGNEFTARCDIGKIAAGSSAVLFFSSNGEHRHCCGVSHSENTKGAFETLPSQICIYYGKSRNGALQFVDQQKKTYLTPQRQFPCADKAQPGTFFRIRYSIRKREDGTDMFNIRVVEPVETDEIDNDALPALLYYEGKIKLGTAIDSPSFAGNVFIPPELCAALVERGIEDGTPVYGQYVTLRSHTTNGKEPKYPIRKNAVSCKILKGDELERFLSENK